MRIPVSTPESGHPADGWYRIEVDGERPLPTEIDDPPIESGMFEFPLETDKGQRMVRGICIYNEKYKADEKLRACPMGCLVNLQARDGGLWGQIYWTKAGEEFLNRCGHRAYFLPKYDLAESVITEGLNSTKVSPRHLIGLSITDDSGDWLADQFRKN
jgi:hypothetical protein